MKRLIIAAVFITMTTIALTLAFPAIADARPCQVADTYYYDDTCTTLLGHSYVDCNGICENCFGVITANDQEYDYCCGNTSCDDEGDGCGDAGYLGCFFSGACASC